MNTAEIDKIVDEVVARVSATMAAGAAPQAHTHDESCQCPDKKGAAQASEALASAGACRVGTSGTTAGCDTLAAAIDHTLLKPTATSAEVEQLCHEARQHKFASVCVNTSFVDLCASLLAGSGVKVCCVVGFPLGAMSSESKAFETRDAVRRGADEIDMVVNVGRLKDGDFQYVVDDIRAVVRAAGGRTVKVILETALLTDDDKVAGCVLSKAAGAHFVKTSTGFGPGGATAEDIALMRRVVGDKMGVKASGGIRDCDTARKMVESGATRIGASASVSIIRGESSKSSY